MQTVWVEPAEDMPLRKEDKTWIANEIRLAIGEHLNPHGWRRAQQFIPLATMGTIFLALLALAGAGWNYAFSRVDKEARFETNTTDRLGTIDGTLKDLRKAVDEIRLKQLSASSTSPQSIKETQDVLRTARLNEVRLNSETIADAGIRFVNASGTRPDAWATVQEFLSYRSYLNSVTVPLAPQVALNSGQSRYAFSIENVPKIDSMSTIGASKDSDAAQLRNISGSDLNSATGYGPSLIVLKAPTVILDTLYAKNVVFENAHIIYRDGPVTLDNVYFLNCTFEIENHVKGQEMAKKILADAATTFLST